MSEKLIIKIQSSQGLGERLDKFLTERFPEYSRSKIQKMIKSENVLVNGQAATVHRFLKDNDEIIILPEGEEKPAAKEGKSIKMAAAAGKKKSAVMYEPKIIDDTRDYMIIEKPSGMLVHPTDKGETNTLIDWVAKKYPQTAKIGDEPGRAAIVHRLDKEVSGLMVIPKTQDAFEHFKRLFKIRQMGKKYTALVYGVVKADTGEINFPIARRGSRDGLFIASPIGSEVGKAAKTLFSVKKRFVNNTLLEVEIMTGRTHQIRVHMLAYNHPIVGDPLYKSRTLKEKAKISRIFLHAAELSFAGPDGKKHEYNSELPKELKEYLKKI